MSKNVTGRILFYGGIAVGLLVFAFVIYILPYLVADANSQGWLATGKYAEANLYPQLALDSYKQALDRFPKKERTFPQGTAVAEAGKRLLALREKMTGLPFVDLQRLVDKKDFAGLYALATGDRFDAKSLRLDFFSADEKKALADKTGSFAEYLKKLVAVPVDGGVMYADTYTFIKPDEFRAKAVVLLDAYRDAVVGTGIFPAEDAERVTALFKSDYAALAAVKDESSAHAALPALRRGIEAKLDLVKGQVKRGHVARAKKVGLLCTAAIKDGKDYDALSSRLHTLRDAVEETLKSLASAAAIDAAKLGTARAEMLKVVDEMEKKFDVFVADLAKLETELGKAMPRLAALKEQKERFKVIREELGAAAKQAEGFVNQYLALEAQLKVLRKQGGADAERRLKELKKDAQSARFLPRSYEARNTIANAVVSFDQDINTVKTGFSNKVGEFDINGRLEMLGQTAERACGDFVAKVHLSRDKRLLFVELLIDEDKLSVNINARLDEIFKVIFDKNVAKIDEFLAGGDRAKLEALLAKFGPGGYHADFDKAYLDAVLWRLDYADWDNGKGGDAERILARIRAFSCFPDKNGTLGTRFETLSLNQKLLIPVALKLAAAGGGKHADFVKELQKALKAK